MTRKVQHEAPDPGVLVLPQRRDRLVVAVKALVGVDDGLVQERRRRRGQVGVHHAVAVVRNEFVLEELRKRGGRHRSLTEVVHGVLHRLELDLENHPEQPIAPDHSAEQLRIVAAVDLPDRPVHEHHAH